VQDGDPPLLVFAFQLSWSFFAQALETAREDFRLSAGSARAALQQDVVQL
jgi:hypothetical protein